MSISCNTYFNQTGTQVFSDADIWANVIKSPFQSFQRGTIRCKTCHSLLAGISGGLQIHTKILDCLWKQMVYWRIPLLPEQWSMDAAQHQLPGLGSAVWLSSIQQFRDHYQLVQWLFHYFKVTPPAASELGPPSSSDCSDYIMWLDYEAVHLTYVGWTNIHYLKTSFSNVSTICGTKQLLFERDRS